MHNLDKCLNLYPLTDTAKSRKGTKMNGLRRGDKKLIAEITGLAYVTVRKTLAGSRHNAQVLEAARALLDNREKFLQDYKSN